MQHAILETYFKAERVANDLTQSTGLYHPVNAQMAQNMRKLGFYSLGSGMYSSVWRETATGRVFKINSNINGKFDGFYAWMLACMQVEDNPALPSFGDLIQIGQRYCVELTPLYVQDQILCTDGLFKAIQSNDDLADAVLLALKTAANCCSQYAKKHFASYETKDITTRCMDTWLDIHKGNLLQRRGHIVLNDPIASLESEIESVGVQYATYASAA